MSSKTRVRPDYRPRLDTAHETPPFATKLLLRLLAAESAQSIVTSLDNPPSVSLSDALINDPGPTAARHAPASRYYGDTRRTAQLLAGGFDGWRAHLSSDPPIYRVIQHEFSNDESGRFLKVFRKSPCPPRARYSSPGSDTEDPEGLS